MKHKITEVKLSNGAQGLLLDVADAPVMHFLFCFRAGDFLAPKGKWDVPHILEHMMLGANKKYPKGRAYIAEVEKNGAYINAYTSSLDVGYEGECADFEWKRFMDLMLVGLEQPLLLASEFQAEKGNVREELTGDLNKLFRQLMLRTAQQHGLVSLPDIERIEQLDNITLPDITHHYAKTHTLRNLRFIISGAVAGREAEIIGRLEAISLDRGKRFSLPNEVPVGSKEVLYIDHPGTSNLHFIINVLARHRVEREDDEALNLLNNMLTSTIHSGILGEAREKGLAYNISSSYGLGDEVTNWWLGAQIRPENAPAVFQIIIKHIKQMLGGTIKKSDLEAAKKYTLGRISRHTQTAGDLARNYASRYFLSGEIEEFALVESRILALDVDKLTNVSRRIFDDKLWGVGVLAADSEDLARTLYSDASVLWQ